MEIFGGATKNLKQVPNSLRHKRIKTHNSHFMTPPNILYKKGGEKMTGLALYSVRNLDSNRKRGYASMAEQKDNSSDGQNTVPRKSLLDNVSKKAIALCGMACTAIASLLIGVAIPNIFILPEKIGFLDKRVTELEESLTRIEESIHLIDKSLAGMGIETGISVTDVDTDSAFAVRLNYTLNDRNLPAQESVDFISEDTVVGYKKGTGEEVTAGEISNQKVLLPYKNGDQEVFFYGQINEKGCWDGNCILNAYKDNKLELITDAIYDDGKLVSCKQVFYYDFELNDGTQPVWAYSDRTHEEEVDRGGTWLYLKENDHFKDFTFDDVAADDIMSADKFWDNLKMNSRKIAYYCGNTVDGYFNDDTGDAYVIHYFTDGSIRYLGSGIFINGEFTDSTGNAWYIVRDEDSDYMCYRGKVKNGNLISKSNLKIFSTPLKPDDLQALSESWQNSRIQLYIGNRLTKKDIETIIGNRKFDGDGELNWVDRNGPLT